jgi:hypothetical protein
MDVMKVPTVHDADHRESSDQKGSVSNLRRYNLVLPEQLYLNLQEVSERRHTSVLELLKKFIRLGLVVDSLDENASVILREGSREREILLF